MTQQRNQILVARSLPNVPVPGLYDLLVRRNGGVVDLWMNMRWDTPGCLLNDTGVTAPGAARDAGTGFWGDVPHAADRGDHLLSVRRHALNPISWGEPLDSELTSRYLPCAASRSRIRTR